MAGTGLSRNLALFSSRERAPGRAGHFRQSRHGPTLVSSGVLPQVGWHVWLFLRQWQVNMLRHQWPGETSGLGWQAGNPTAGR